MKKRVLAAAMAGMMILGSAGLAMAEEAVWPNGDVTFYCGYQVGSLTDINVHTIADWITEKTGATVIVENNDVGGGANLAAKLVQAEPDGQTIMLIGMNCISNYYSDIWSVNPADPEQFKIVCGFIQPWPNSGCMVMTQADAPYSNWEELAAYAEEHPGEVTVASIPGKVMDIKMKALFNGTGLSDKIRWVSTTSSDAAAGLLGGNINIIMLDEYTALSYIRDGSSKALINSRVSDDFSMYEDADREIMEGVQTLVQAFGEEGEAYMVPNTSVVAVPVGTPDEICAEITKIIDSIDEETEGDWYDRCRVNGGTSKYYAFSADELQEEWARLDPVIKEICEMQ